MVWCHLLLGVVVIIITMNFVNIFTTTVIHHRRCFWLLALFQVHQQPLALRYSQDPQSADGESTLKNGGKGDKCANSHSPIDRQGSRVPR